MRCPVDGRARQASVSVSSVGASSTLRAPFPFLSTTGAPPDSHTALRAKRRLGLLSHATRRSPTAHTPRVPTPTRPYTCALRRSLLDARPLYAHVYGYSCKAVHSHIHPFTMHVQVKTTRRNCLGRTIGEVDLHTTPLVWRVTSPRTRPTWGGHLYLAPIS